MFHIDDVILTHLYPQVVTEYIKRLDVIYGKKDPLTVTRGKVHDYLGMMIDFRMEDRYSFTQCDTVKKFWMSLSEDLHRPCKSTPAPDGLFKVDKDSEKLDEVKTEQCHSATAKSLCFG